MTEHCDLLVDEQSNTVRDAIGVTHRRVGKHLGAEVRIASLVPSLTELICDLGLAEQLVARTGFCIHPKEIVRQVPKVGGTKDVDMVKLRSLNPTHVIVNIDENEQSIYDELKTFVDHVFVTHPLVPEDNVSLFLALGSLFDREEQAQKLIADFNRALELLGENAQRTPQRVLYLIWKDPWMCVSSDTYISKMLGLIGWQTVGGDTYRRYPEVGLESRVGHVDRVLLSSEPYTFREKHVTEVKSIFGESAIVELVDGEMLSWYGSRAIAGLKYLAHCAEAA